MEAREKAIKTIERMGNVYIELIKEEKEVIHLRATPIKTTTRTL